MSLQVQRSKKGKKIFDASILRDTERVHGVRAIAPLNSGSRSGPSLKPGTKISRGSAFPMAQ